MTPNLLLIFMTVLIIYALVLGIVVGIAYAYRECQPDVPWWKRWML